VYLFNNATDCNNEDFSNIEDLFRNTFGCFANSALGNQLSRAINRTQH